MMARGLWFNSYIKDVEKDIQVSSFKNLIKIAYLRLHQLQLRFVMRLMGERMSQNPTEMGK
jgi:hypothetical protein